MSIIERALELLPDLSLDRRIDRLVGTFFPDVEVRRLRDRAAARQLSRAYDGGKKGRRTENWKASNGSANADLVGTLQTLRARSRDLIRNNPYAARGIDVICANVIGTGIIPQAKGIGGRRQKQVQDLWKSWGETTACDIEGRHDHFGLQNLAVRTMAASGELLIRFVTNRDPYLPVPLQLQVLEPDFLDTSKDGVLANKNRIIQGIEFEGMRRVAYHLFLEHPGESVARSTSWQSVRVPASEVIHVFRQDRPGQVRGVPWLAPVIMRLRDLDDYEDAQLVRQKIAACYTAFVIDPNGAPENESESDLEEFGRFMPGQIERLEPGQDIRFGNPPAAEGFSDFTRAFIRSVAVGLGITYEAISGDYGNVNFSSGRMGWMEMARNVDAWRWLLIQPQFNAPTYQRFIAAAELAGKAKGPVWPTWTPPRREMIDPGKETAAAIEQIKGGLKSWSEVVRENGADPYETAAEIAADQKLFDELGLKLTSDNRVAAAAKPTPALPPKKKADETDDEEADGEGDDDDAA